MKSNKAKDNASLNFFANEKKPKYNAKNEIITRINNLNEKFSPPKPYNLTTTQTRSYESNIVNRSLNQFTRKPLTLNENSYSKNNIEQFSNQQKPVDKDNKLENEFVLEIKNLTEELEKQKKILNEKKKLNEEKVIYINIILKTLN